MNDFAIHNCDCVTGFTEHLEPDSVDLTVTSIPFADLFMYSGKNEDIGNSGAAGTDFVASIFGIHLRFCAEQLLAVHKPGTVAAIHVQQLVATKVEHGYMGRRDFLGSTIQVFVSAGFDYTGDVAIPKNPQAVAQRTKRHSLLFATGERDARMLAPTVNDYVIFLKKRGTADPVPALRTERNQAGWVTREEWIKWASGVWGDIRETDVLEGWRDGRDTDDEKHVCPLQLEVIRRCVKLYTNPGELVLDPFMGIGSTAYVALEQGRRAVGFELKESYHRQALKNAELALERGPEGQTNLIDLLAESAAA